MELIEGDTVALIGRNGAGKTTTLRSIMSVIKPQTGTITYNKKDITQTDPHEIARRGIGFIPEDRRIFPSLTVEENLRTGIINDGDAARIDEVYDLFPRLQERQNQDGSTLSGGEQQMLAIGRTLISDPDLMLIDEPSEGLMPSLVEMIKETIIELNESGRTILLVEQNAKMAFEASDHVYIIDKGTIRAHGPTEKMSQDESIQQRYLGV